MTVQSVPYTDLVLDQFRVVQRLAYAVAAEVESGLEVGITEREVAAQLSAALDRCRGRAGVP